MMKEKGNVQGSFFYRYLYRRYWRFSGVSHFLKLRLTTAGWFVLSALVISAVMGVDTTRSANYQMFTLLLSVILVALFFNLRFKVHLRVIREMPRLGTVGEPLQYRVRVVNEGKRDWRGLRMCERLPEIRPDCERFVTTREPLEESRNFVDRKLVFYRWLWLMELARVAKWKESEPFDVPAGGHVDIDIEMTPLRRGVLELGEALVFRTDPFGLFRICRAVDSAFAKMIIIPKRYALPAIDLPGESRYQPGGISFASSIGQSEEFMGLREYRSGDAIRHIHWRSWARVGKPIVKEFEDEYFPRYALILDSFGTDTQPTIFEEAVSIAASFACTVDTKESLLDLMFVGTEAYCFTLGRGVSQVESMLEILAAVHLSPVARWDELKKLIDTRVRDVSACICVLLAWDEERKNFVKHLRFYGVSLRVLVVCGDGERDVLAAENTNGDVHFIEESNVAAQLVNLKAI